MNILIIHEVDWVKKITYEIHHLSEFFSKYGHNVFAIDIIDPGVFSFKKSAFEEISNYHRLYDDAKVHIFHTPMIPIKGLHRISAHFLSYRFIKKILVQNKIDIVFSYSVLTNSEATLKACHELHVPVVHRTLDVIHELLREKFLRKRAYKIEKNIYPKFDLVLSHTPFMKKWSEEMGAKNVDVVPQGVDGNIMKLVPKNNDLQKSLEISDDDRVVMYLGTVYSFSGVDTIIESIPNIVKKIPHFKFLVVGGGPDLSMFKNKAKECNVEKYVIFTDFIPYKEVSNYCSLAEIFVNPFQIIGLTDKLSPVKIFDLLSCAKPVIATPLEGLLHDFPKNSNVLIYSDLKDFEKNIISLLNNSELDTIGKRGREFVEKNFTWEKVTERILEKFSDLLHNK
jgi:glycosyltransferase involved in cell wall biosynthesis